MVWWYSEGFRAGRSDWNLVDTQGLFFLAKPWAFGMRLDT
jgi:hypothetical protein